jgi:serine/threonine protein kinase
MKQVAAAATKASRKIIPRSLQIDVLDDVENGANDPFCMDASYQLVKTTTTPTIISTNDDDVDTRDVIVRPSSLVYRHHDGVLSIGRDFLRWEGITIHRGIVSPEHLEIFSNRILGQGAFSTVRYARWKQLPTPAATHDEHDVDTSWTVRDVAVKVIDGMEQSRQRRKMLLEELRALCKVSCDCLVQLHGAFLQQPDESNASPSVALVLEYMDRGSLEDFLRRIKIPNKQNPPSDLNSEAWIASVAYPMLCGLSFLHQHRILHRDLKPANVLLHSNGSVKLADFGMAGCLGEESCNVTVWGTTHFLAPERLRAKPYGRPSDVWSLGMVLWECTTGKSPFAQEDIRSMVDLLVTIEETDDFRKLLLDTQPFVSLGLQEILVGCLQEDPGQYHIPIDVACV